MALAAKAALTALVTTVEGIPGVGHVARGVPESLPNTVSAYVALAAQPLGMKADHCLQRDGSYLVVFGYRVKNHEETAEDTLADVIDAFIEQFYADRLNGAGLFHSETTEVHTGDLDLTLAGGPEYQIVAGQEFRLFPILVTASQRTNN